MKEIPTYTVDWGFGVSSEGYVGKFFRLLLSVIWVKVILRVAKRYLNVFFCFVQTFTVSNRVKQKQEGIPKEKLLPGCRWDELPTPEASKGIPTWISIINCCASELRVVPILLAKLLGNR